MNFRQTVHSMYSTVYINMITIIPIIFCFYRLRMRKIHCRNNCSKKCTAIVCITVFIALYFLLGGSKCLIIHANEQYQLVSENDAAMDSCSSTKSHHNPSKCTCLCQRDLTTKVLSGKYRGKTPSSTFLIIVIFSKPSSFTLRNSCRNTWMKGYNGTSEVTFKFVIGLGGVDDALRKRIKSESDTYGDLLILDDHEERYGPQCTKKLQLTLQWATVHSKSLFFMKTDDDVYVRLSYILVLLHKRWSQTAKPFLCGTIICNESPNIFGKWAEHNWLLNKYLPFSYGSGYIVPMSLARAVVASNNYVHMRKLRNEDVTLGMWLAMYDIDYIHIKRYSKKYYLMRVCPTNAKEIAVFHYPQSAKMMQEVHPNLRKLEEEGLCACEEDLNQNLTSFP